MLYFSRIDRRLPGVHVAGETLAAGNVVMLNSAGAVMKCTGNAPDLVVGMIDRIYAATQDVEVVTAGAFVDTAGTYAEETALGLHTSTAGLLSTTYVATTAFAHAVSPTKVEFSV